MGEFNPFELDEFSWDMLNVYLKHGYGNVKLYDTTSFSCHFSDETVCMTLQEFHDRAVDYEGELWTQK